MALATFSKRLTISFCGLLTFIVGGLFAASEKAYACSCIANLPLQTHVERSSAVFSGKVVRVNETTGRISFDVSGVWKGKVTEQFSLQGAGDSAACGWNPKVGEEYVVYAHKESPDGITYSTNLCSRNKLVKEAAADLKLLRDPFPPDPNEKPSGGAGMFLVFLGIGVFIVAGIVGIARTRRL